MAISTFQEAIPYGVGTLAIGTVGAITAVAASAVALKVIGVSLAIIGAYGFFATVVCGIVNAGNPAQFKAEWTKYAGTMIGSAISNIIAQIVREVISSLLDQGLGRRVTVHREAVI